MMPELQPSIALDSIIHRIFEVRGQRVMLDADLAILYGVETRYIPRAVKRNPGRFPADFAFQLSDEEWTNLKSTLGISSSWGGRRSAPYVFTEHGALMLSSTLNSQRADEISLMIVRAFVWLRQSVPAYQELAVKVAELEETAGKHDVALSGIIETLNELIVPKNPQKRKIGY